MMIRKRTKAVAEDELMGTSSSTIFISDSTSRSKKSNEEQPKKIRHRR
jgi:hypothetical protein